MTKIGKIITLLLSPIMLFGVSAYADALGADWVYKDFEVTNGVLCDFQNSTLERITNNGHNSNASLKITKLNSDEDFGYNLFFEKGKIYKIGAFAKNAPNGFEITIKSSENPKKNKTLTVNKSAGSEWTYIETEFLCDESDGVLNSVSFNSLSNGEYYIDKLFVVPVSEGNVSVTGEVKVGSDIMFDISNNERYYYNIYVNDSGKERVIENGYTQDGTIAFKIPSIAEGKELFLRYSPVDENGTPLQYIIYNAGTVLQGIKTPVSINTQNKPNYFDNGVFAGSFIDEQYNYDYSSTLKTDPYNAAWEKVKFSFDENASETGAFRFDLKGDFGASPDYYLRLEKGKTYKLNARVKIEEDINSHYFAFYISGQQDENGEEEQTSYEMLTIQNNEFKAGVWNDVEAYFTWNGQLGSSDTVLIRIRVGNGRREDWFGNDTERTTSAYYLDNFSVMPYNPDISVRMAGDMYVGGTARLETSCDKVVQNSYPIMYNPLFFTQYTGSIAFYKVNNEVVDVGYGTNTQISNKSEYLNKNISCDLYPIMYGEVKNKTSVDLGTVKTRDNSFVVKYFEKVINPFSDAVAGRVDAKIYDYTTPQYLSASYKDNRLQNSVVGERFSVAVDNADKISTYVWDENMSPITDKQNLVKDKNAILLYVDANSGNDENSGTINAPFKTIERAKAEVKELLRKYNSEDLLTWSYEDNILTISGTGNMRNYFGAEAPWEQYKNSIRTLILEEGITSIGATAFSDCTQLKNAVLPDSLEYIGEDAFSGCENLIAVVLGDNLTNIESSAFPETTNKCVSKASVFADKTGYKTYTAGEAGSAAISPAEQTNIGWALYDDTLVFEGSGQFVNVKSDFQATAPWKDYKGRITTAVIQPGITRTPYYLFSGKTDGVSDYANLKRYTIADTVTRLSHNEIAECTGLEYINLSSKTTNVEQYITGNGLNVPIKSLTIPAGVATIGTVAMNNLSGLERLVFEEGFNITGRGATSQWESAFRQISGLKEITLPASWESIGSYFFSGINNLERIVVLNPGMEFKANCFDNIPKTGTVAGYKNSTAEAFAQTIGWTFEEISPTYSVNTLSALNARDRGGSIDRIYVNIKAGEYFIDDTLEFTHDDSGAIDVIYTSYGDGQAVLSGGRQISDWEIEDAAKNIYKAYVGLGVNSRQFYVDGVKAQRAKGELTNYTVDAKGILCENQELLSFQHPEDLEIYFHKVWTAPICRVDTVTAEGDNVRIKLNESAWNVLLTRNSGAVETETVYFPDNIYSYENAYELIDEEGEWYLNTHDGYIYYKPRKYEDMQNVKAILPVTEQLVKVDNAKNIKFEDVSFKYTTWNKPTTDNGFFGGQNSVIWTDKTRDYKFVDGAVEVVASKNIDFVNCTFSKLGSVGLKLMQGVSDCDIVGNEIYDISANGICLGGQRIEEDHMPSEDKQNKNNTIINNLIHSIGKDYHGGSAISTTYLKDTTIQNNEIFNVSYMGIHMGHVDDDNYIENLNVINNYVHDTVNNMVEGSAIYTFGATKGNNIIGNYTTYGWGRTGGIANDNGSTNLTITNNVIDGTHSWNCVDEYAKDYLADWRPSDSGFGNSDGTGIVFENNFGTYGMGYSKNREYNGEIKSHTVCEFAVWPDEAKAIIKASGLEDGYYLEHQEVAREIVLNDSYEIELGDTVDLEFTAFGEKYEAYPGNSLEMYLYSTNDNIVEVIENEQLKANQRGLTTVKACFKNGDVLREYIVEITVK